MRGSFSPKPLVARLRAYRRFVVAAFARGLLACRAEACFVWLRSGQTSARRRLENTGLEPVTSWLQTRRSPS